MFLYIQRMEAGCFRVRLVCVESRKKKGRIRLVYRVVGKGTNEFSALKAGDEIEILGPLGNGFIKEPGKAILIGGGIGIPPMLLSWQRN